MVLMQRPFPRSSVCLVIRRSVMVRAISPSSVVMAFCPHVAQRSGVYVLRGTVMLLVGSRRRHGNRSLLSWSGADR